MRVTVGAERHTNRVLVPFHLIGGGVLLRCLIVLFVIVPFLVSGARAGAYPVDEAPALRIAQLIEVTDGSTEYMQPIWSPDGKKLAFTKSSFTGIYVRNADGSGPIQEITPSAYSGYKPVWTSDSRAIILQTRTGAVGKSITAIDVESGEVKTFSAAKCFALIILSSPLSFQLKNQHLSLCLL